ncbi:MAG: hypothetical protein KKD77_20520 [Gammaproteobacteria bacterium]|nr:hypothetical protein [Gammaproteobacteria bacterium]
MRDEDQRQEIDISNPVLGRLAAKGVRISDLLGLFTFIGVLSIGFFIWKSSDAAVVERGAIVKEVAAQRKEANETNRELIGALKSVAISNRMTSCIISQPQDKRERQFTEPNSLCRRLSAPD